MQFFEPFLSLLPSFALFCPPCRTKRQGYFTRTAAIALALQIPYSATFVGSFGAVLAQPNCQYPYQTLAVLEFVQVMV